MDQKERLERVKQLRDERAQLRIKASGITHEIIMLLKECDHTNEDGSDAIKNVYEAGDQRNERECQICGACWNIFGVRL